MVISSTNPHNREVAIRRRISSMQSVAIHKLSALPGSFSEYALLVCYLIRYNKREEDFPSLREYNDYLEAVEDMIFNLVEGIDVHTIEEKIQQYQRENSEQIMINQARKAEELAAALAACKGIPAQNDTEGASNQPSQGGIGVDTQGKYAPTIAGGQPRPTGMGPQPIPLPGSMDMHGYEDEETMKLRAERAARAGGWSIELSRKRALEEAFASIWF